MPKIDAPTVAEHHAIVQRRLVDAAEEILRRRPSEPLTAGAVSSAAGIARNSIYRYVDSVDDLRGLVVDRYLPDWMNAVAAAMAAAATPAQQVVAWVGANLEQSTVTGHGWLMDAARAMSPNVSIDQAVAQAHAGMWTSLTDAWRSLLPANPERVPIAVSMTVGLLDAGLRQLDADQPAHLVLTMNTDATRALTTALQST